MSNFLQFVEAHQHMDCLSVLKEKKIPSFEDLKNPSVLKRAFGPAFSQFKAPHLLEQREERRKK